MSEKNRDPLCTADRGNSPFFLYISVCCTLGLFLWSVAVLPAFVFPETGVSIGLMSHIVFTWLFLSLRYQRHTLITFLVFLLTCVGFSLTFWWRVSYPVQLWLLISIVAVGVVMFLLVLPRIEHRLIPVIIISLILTSFVWAACEYWLQEHSFSAGVGVAGAILWSLVTFRLTILPLDDSRYVANRWIAGLYQLALAGIVGSVLI